MGIRVLVLGASGLVGRHVLRSADHPGIEQVIAPTRTALPAHSKLSNPHADRLETLASDVKAVDAVICALGTTMANWRIHVIAHLLCPDQGRGRARPSTGRISLVYDSATNVHRRRSGRVPTWGGGYPPILQAFQAAPATRISGECRIGHRRGSDQRHNVPRRGRLLHLLEGFNREPDVKSRISLSIRVGRTEAMKGEGYDGQTGTRGDN
jgi:hypothetical protein